MARFAALYCRKIESRPTAFAQIVGPAGVGALLSEVKRSEASHEDNKAPRCAGLVLLEGPAERRLCLDGTSQL